MADQSLTQPGALDEVVVQCRRTDKGLLPKFRGGSRTILRWARFVLLGDRLSMPELADFAVGNHLFWAKQIRGELAALGQIIANLRPECALEIGTCHGGTLFFLTRLASSKATIVSVDLPGGEFGGGYSATRQWFYQRFGRHGQRLHLLRGNSHSDSMLESVKTTLKGRALDYLFIDGDHTYEGVKRDFELYASLVRSGGIIALHDVAQHSSETGCEVSRLWNEIKCECRHTEIIENPTQGWAGIGVLYVE